MDTPEEPAARLVAANQALQRAWALLQQTEPGDDRYSQRLRATQQAERAWAAAEGAYWRHHDGA